MFFEHIYDKTLAQGSYLIGCQETGEAMVIDARRDIQPYLEIAQKNNFKITHITETHIHADFLCGSRELAAATGATMYLSDEGDAGWQYEFPHQGIKDGDRIKMGNLSFEVIHTPGHTPESVSFLLTDGAASDKPTMLFSGDFVFVGDVGRPDLLEEAAGVKGTKEVGARQMFHSIQKFLKLPDYVQVWPAHGAGSACGKALGAVPSSTVGYEKITNWAMQFGNDEDGFVKALLAGQPEPPKYFAMMKLLNHTRRPIKMELPVYPKLDDDQFFAAFEKGIKIIDTRPLKEVKDSFIPGTLSVPNNKSFSTWMGWLVNFEEQFIVLADESEMEEISKKLVRIGLDNLYGFYDNYGELMMRVGFEPFKVIDFEGVNKKMTGSDVQILDVRGKSEFAIGHIRGATNIHVGKLTDHLDQISRDKTVIVHCQSGGRSSIAYSVLKKEGYKDILNYMGSMNDWSKKQGQLIKEELKK